VSHDSDNLVERRRRYIQRQIEIDKGAVNVKFAGMRPNGTGAPNRHGMPKLPVGQHEVKNWPVLDLGEQPRVSTAEWTNLSLARAIEDDVLLVHTWEGEPLPREHGGPCRMITPKLYAWKGAKWIRRIEFLAADRKGFWEVRGYSNSAEPWFNDRYST
jgi:DMSO/TMAO reductase YedYZ molybdopterin-dependent catalytic subunit